MCTVISMEVKMNLNRNDICWCGSGKKYKKCHLEFDEKLNRLKEPRPWSAYKGYDKKMKSRFKELEKVLKLMMVFLDLVEEKIRIGMNTEEIDKLVYDYTIEHGAIPADLNYGGYPKSVCVSINDVVCHGIPSEDTILQDGDIVNVDVSTIYNGYYSDASRMFMLGNVSEEHAKTC